MEPGKLDNNILRGPREGCRRAGEEAEEGFPGKGCWGRGIPIAVSWVEEMARGSMVLRTEP